MRVDYSVEIDEQGIKINHVDDWQLPAANTEVMRLCAVAVVSTPNEWRWTWAGITP